MGKTRPQPERFKVYNAPSSCDRLTATNVCLLVVVILALRAGVPYLFSFLPGNHFNDRGFSAAEWAAFDNSTNPDSPRGQMYQDLVRHYLKRGMSRQEVFDLLGKPDRGMTDDRFSYNLGMWSVFRIDYDSLEIEFDSGGLVRSVYHIQH